MLYKIGGFAVGGAMSAGCILGMNDIIYSELRRNVIMPFRKIIGTEQKQVSLDDLYAIGEGSANFASQFKPHALGPTNVKALLMTDQDYATPQDHYFSYINKRRTTNENEREQDIIKSLDLKKVLPQNYNIETGNLDSVDSIQLLDENGVPLNEEEMDIFELARLKGKRIGDLEQLMPDTQRDHIRRVENKGQKHNKKEYEKLKSMTLGNIFAVTKEETIKRQYEDDAMVKDMVKIEKKKGTKKKTKEQRLRDIEIQKMLQNPQDIDYDKAMKMYDQQNLEAKQVTAKDKRRLRRLKKKAEDQQPLVLQQNENSIQQQQQVQQSDETPRAAAIKIEPTANIFDEMEPEHK